MYTKFQISQKNTMKGFTLIEVMVSMSIFVMVIGMAGGTVIVMIDANAKAQNMQQTATNLSFALDSMSREIRTGLFYYGVEGDPVSSGTNVQDCSSCRAMSFVEAGGSLTTGCTGGAGGGRVSYRHNNNTIERRLCDGSWNAIVAPNVIVTDFNFTVQHTNRDLSRDQESPMVTMFVQAEVNGVENTGAVLELQSSVTQQAIDI